MAQNGGNGTDTDADVLRDAGNTATEIDVRFREADVNERRKLRKPRDDAFNEFSRARLQLMKTGMITTGADVQEMKAIKAEVDRAADNQALIIAVGRFVGFLARL
jgi:hypothetical protein